MCSRYGSELSGGLGNASGLQYGRIWFGYNYLDLVSTEQDL